MSIREIGRKNYNTKNEEVFEFLVQGVGNNLVSSKFCARKHFRTFTLPRL